MPASTIWTWGRAKNYRLGRDVLGHDARVPEAVRGFEGAAIRAAACGGGHTAVVRDDGALFVFGYSQYGQLGLGDRTDMCVPTFVPLPPSSLAVDPEVHLLKATINTTSDDGNAMAQAGALLHFPASSGAGANSGVSFRDAHFPSARVADVCCGRYHTIAMTVDGAVYTWGGGKNGRLGHGDEKIRLHPGCVETLLPHRARAITAGYHNNLVLTERGDVWSWGWGAHGQLGTGDTRDRELPTLIDELSGLDVVSLSCGDRHSFAVTSDGTVLGWGSNEFGQLGIGRRGDTFLSPTVIPALAGLVVTALSSGDRHSAAVTNVGTVYTWGCGIDGQCGHGDYCDVSRPRMVRALAHVSVVTVHCGHNFTMATTDMGEVYAWGNNTYGQLGNGGSGKSPLPVRVQSPGKASVSTIVCAHFHCVLITDPDPDSQNAGMRENAAKQLDVALKAEIVSAAFNGQKNANDMTSIRANDFLGDSEGDQVSRSDTIAVANNRFQTLLSKYSQVTEQCTADVNAQSQELIVADILRLSSS